MTLGIFTDDFYPFIGGMGRYVQDLTKHLPPEQVTIFSPGESNRPNHIRVKPVLHHKLRNLSYSLWLHQNVSRIVSKHNLGQINIQCGPGGLFLFKSLGIPVIATCHHTWWQQSHYLPSQFWKRLFVPFERRTYQRANKVLCDAADTREVLIEKYGVPPGKTVVIPIGIDPQLFHPLKKEAVLPNSLLFVGRPDKRKGVDFLLKAIPPVIRQIPDVHLYIGGTGKGSEKLKSHVKNRHIEKNVSFLGFIPEDRLNHWYNRVQCVIVPSVFEGFGLTVLEAMAAGTPVIATEVDSLRDLVEDDRDGYLVTYGDVPMLADRIISLLRDKNKQNSFAEKGKEKVKREYHWDRIAEAFRKEVDSLGHSALP